MKRLIGIALAVGAMFVMAGCTKTESHNTFAGSQNDMPLQHMISCLNGEETLDAHRVRIVSAVKTKTSDHQNAVVVTYEWANCSGEAKSFVSAFDDVVFQNGIACEKTSLVDGVDAKKAMVQIQPGTMLQVQQAYLLTDDSEITVAIAKLVSSSDGAAIRTFPVK